MCTEEEGKKLDCHMAAQNKYLWDFLRENLDATDSGTGNESQLLGEGDSCWGQEAACAVDKGYRCLAYPSQGEGTAKFEGRCNRTSRGSNQLPVSPGTKEAGSISPSDSEQSEANRPPQNGLLLPGLGPSALEEVARRLAIPNDLYLPDTCPCNCTYVSHACCSVNDGIVWEAPVLKMGDLEPPEGRCCEQATGRFQRGPGDDGGLCGEVASY